VRGLLALLLATISAVRAQGPVGTLNGTVLDPAGLAVPGASVVATNRATRHCNPKLNGVFLVL
jgi:hypothetical protein